MNKNIVSNLMIIGGSLYLIELVKLYTNEGTTNFAINLLLIFFYIGFLKVFSSNTQKCISNMKMMVDSEENIPRSYVESLNLKIN